MISIIDIYSGNIRSFVNSYRRLGIDTEVIRTKRELNKAKRIILPGVGSFDSFMGKLELSGLRDTLEAQVLQNQVPIMGVCVGMQVFGQSSEEGQRPGLGWVKGNNILFDTSKKIQVPAMGWNSVESQNNFPLLKGADLERGYYFLHGYYFKEDESLDSKVISRYGDSFTCGFKKNNIFGIQFHPEKSHHNGSILLKNFAEVNL